jgi:3-methyladenine DNA glycosylase Tag
MFSGGERVEPRVVPGWCPFAERPPVTDDEVFEALAAATFQARFRPDVVRARWPLIRAAFADFSLPEVAAWPDDVVDRLLAAPGMIRNPKRVRAVLKNARGLAARIAPSGSAHAWLASADRAALVADVDTWAAYIGAPSIRWFLDCCGVPGT